jgi:hypothetical protein
MSTPPRPCRELLGNDINLWTFPFKEHETVLCIALQMEVTVNPMLFAIVMYQRWLDLVFLPFVKAPPIQPKLKLVPKPTPYEG